MEQISNDIVQEAGLDVIAKTLANPANENGFGDNAFFSHYLMVVKPKNYWKMKVCSAAHCDCIFLVHIDGKQIKTTNCLFSGYTSLTPVTFVCKQDDGDFNFKEVRVQFSDMEIEENNNSMHLSATEQRTKLMEQGVGTIRVAVHRRSYIIPELEVRPVPMFNSSSGTTPKGAFKTLQVGVTCTQPANGRLVEMKTKIAHEHNSFEEHHFYYRSKMACFCEKKILNMPHSSLETGNEDGNEGDEENDNDEGDKNDNETPMVKNEKSTKKRSANGKQADLTRPQSKRQKKGNYPEAASSSTSAVDEEEVIDLSSASNSRDDTVNLDTDNEETMDVPNCMHRMCTRKADVHCPTCFTSLCKIHMDKKHDYDEVDEDHTNAVVPINEYMSSNLKATSKKKKRNIRKSVKQQNKINEENPVTIDD